MNTAQQLEAEATPLSAAERIYLGKMRFEIVLVLEDGKRRTVTKTCEHADKDKAIDEAIADAERFNLRVRYASVKALTGGFEE